MPQISLNVNNQSWCLPINQTGRLIRFPINQQLLAKVSWHVRDLVKTHVRVTTVRTNHRWEVMDELNIL